MSTSHYTGILQLYVHQLSKADILKMEFQKYYIWRDYYIVDENDRLIEVTKFLEEKGDSLEDKEYRVFMIMSGDEVYQMTFGRGDEEYLLRDTSIIDIVKRDDLIINPANSRKIPIPNLVIFTTTWYEDYFGDHDEEYEFFLIDISLLYQFRKPKMT